MRRLRSIRRLGAGLGLFALLLQLALSFGHIHPEDLLAGSAANIHAVADKAQPASPAQDRDAPGAPHDDCPICAAMHLAGAIVLRDAAALALPTQFTVAIFSTDDLVAVVVPRRLPFQTRAPPIA
ncbi:MAG: hypothetical protein JO328_16875 [Hyphomicrobiales bacterium]|nr:hypothetical protein [Hyphomicrobiales bacterium]MBV8824121.1 hypothetical protein [Hyphomicrobiales bacterium]MBV9428369.1 hypothetical protein [Bradyrhizobiaceae bacterium]